MVKLIIIMLPATVTARCLYNIFSQYGYVHEVGIFRHGNRGFLVSMVYKLLCPRRGGIKR